MNQDCRGARVGQRIRLSCALHIGGLGKSQRPMDAMESRSALPSRAEALAHATEIAIPPLCDLKASRGDSVGPRCQCRHLSWRNCGFSEARLWRPAFSRTAFAHAYHKANAHASPNPLSPTSSPHLCHSLYES
ncbi:hypothetical protein L1887_48890 [Cichorium endivia]|nr:hypothetical protein L1887_48890 [Cichorium endivia]